jgi:hypothetical protein
MSSIFLRCCGFELGKYINKQEKRKCKYWIPDQVRNDAFSLRKSAKLTV